MGEGLLFKLPKSVKGVGAVAQRILPQYFFKVEKNLNKFILRNFPNWTELPKRGLETDLGNNASRCDPSSLRLREENSDD
jgi:hypothetical protein